ncbi:MAG: hypothetical protein HQ548_07010 [Chloroflexi bacterium]|nr:hypothetical protein [Chloroflexota bacterium]
MPEKAIETVLAEAADSLMALPGVVGVGQGECDGSPCIRVFVADEMSDVDEHIPREIGGFPVEVVETGPFRALGEE